MKSFLESVNIYEEEQEGGRILKSLKFRFPIFLDGQELYELDWDNESIDETVVLLSKGMVDKDNYRKVKVDFSLEDMDLTELRGKATYA